MISPLSITVYRMVYSIRTCASLSFDLDLTVSYIIASENAKDERAIYTTFPIIGYKRWIADKCTTESNNIHL